MRKGMRIGPDALRTIIALFVLAVLAGLVRDTPALRRYLKSGTM
ncbi:hypothetical protein [Actinomadura sp. 6K520]|jgi:hypothetical protein|nr:hypothetical protein [Actinomadura sp. 6K520]